MTVPYEELAGSPKVNCTADGSFTVDREFLIKWNTSVDFYKELKGFWYSDGSTIIYTPPAAFYGIPACICKEVSFDAWGDRILTPSPGRLAPSAGAPAGDVRNDTTNQPEFALVRAHYSSEQSQQQNDTLNSLIPQGTFITFNDDVGMHKQPLGSEGGKMVYGQNKKVVKDVSMSIDTPVDAFSMTWEKVPYQLIPYDAIAKSRGTINQNQFWVYPPNMVLFIGAKMKFAKQFSGEVLASLEYTFSAKTCRTNNGQLVSGWLQYWIPEYGDYQPIVSLNGNKPPYTTSNFNNLFVPDESSVVIG